MISNAFLIISVHIPVFQSFHLLISIFRIALELDFFTSLKYFPKFGASSWQTEYSLPREKKLAWVPKYFRQKLPVYEIFFDSWDTYLYILSAALNNLNERHDRSQERKDLKSSQQDRLNSLVFHKDWSPDGASSSFC